MCARIANTITFISKWASNHTESRPVLYKEKSPESVPIRLFTGVNVFVEQPYFYLGFCSVYCHRTIEKDCSIMASCLCVCACVFKGGWDMPKREICSKCPHFCDL